MQTRHHGRTHMARHAKPLGKGSAARKHLPPGKFVFGEGPPSSHRFPIPNEEHAGRAIQSLLRIAGRHGVTEASRREALAVLEAVKRRSPHVFAGERSLVEEVMETFGIEDR